MLIIYCTTHICIQRCIYVLYLENKVFILSLDEFSSELWTHSLQVFPISAFCLPISATYPIIPDFYTFMQSMFILTK